MASSSFVFYDSFYEAISKLPDADQLAVYNALCQYALYDIEPECDGVVAAMFMLMRPQIDANKRRRENGKLGASSGNKGGRPSKKADEIPEAENDNAANKETNPKITPNKPQDNPTQTPNVNANANVNVNVNDIPPISPKGDDAATNTKPQKRKQEPAEGFDEFWAAYPKREAKVTAVARWNSLRPNEATRRAILADLERRRRSPDWLKENGKYIPLPATYLNQRRWEDEGTVIANYSDPARYENMDLGGFREAADDEFS